MAGLCRERRDGLGEEEEGPCTEGDRRGGRSGPVGAPTGLAGRLEGSVLVEARALFVGLCSG